jgi:hypothetical protein
MRNSGTNGSVVKIEEHKHIALAVASAARDIAPIVTTERTLPRSMDGRASEAEVRNQADSCLLLAPRGKRRQRHLHTKSSAYKHLRKESVAAGGHFTQSGTAETLRLAIRSSVMAIRARRLRLWAEDCPDSAGFSGTHVPDGAA